MIAMGLPSVENHVSLTRCLDDPPKEEEVDEWASFAPVKKGKKGKKGNKIDEVVPAAAPDPPPAVEKFDAFTEIQLDDTAPMLDLNFGAETSDKKTTEYSWGSNWNTGAKQTTR